MNIVCFNVNGIRARNHQLAELTHKYQPMIVGLQETKVHDEQFPVSDVEALGYEIAFHGQKSHYGVAILSKLPILKVTKGFPTDDEDAQRRFIHIEVEYQGKPLHILNGYFPQGESRDHPTKFPAKQKYYADILNYLNDNFTQDDQVILMGDMNISPEDNDIGIGEPNRKRWLRTGKCSFLPEEREWLEKIKAWGMTDSFRLMNPETTDRFSWFDYRSRGFNDDPKRGLRIDLIMVSPGLQDKMKSTDIYYDIRGMEKPSDHAPISLVLK